MQCIFHSEQTLFFWRAEMKKVSKKTSRKKQALCGVSALPASHPDCLHFPFFCSTFWQIVFCQHRHRMENPSQHCFLRTVAPALSPLPRGGLEHPSALFLIPSIKPNQLHCHLSATFLRKGPEVPQGTSVLLPHNWSLVPENHSSVPRLNYNRGLQSNQHGCN